MGSKTIHLCESFSVRVEVHSRGAANLHVLGAMAVQGEFHEHSLLHPLVDFDAEKPWPKEVFDPVDAEGNVPMPQGPWLGESIDWDFIRDNLVEDRR